MNALGKYGHAVTAGVVAVVLVAWVVIQLLLSMGLADRTPALLDTLAFAAFTYLLGNVSALNGLKAPVQAAHARLDAMGAPPAELAEQLVAGHNAGLHAHLDPRCPICTPPTGQVGYRMPPGA